MNAIALGCLTALLCHHLARRAEPPSHNLLYAIELLGWLPVAWFATWPRWPWLRAPGHFLAIPTLTAPLG